MSIGVKVGKEATHGTVASSFASVAAGFTSQHRSATVSPDEGRNGQDVNFATMVGIRWEEFALAESYVYHDTTGLWLNSVFGPPAKVTVDTIFDNTWKFGNDPTSLSLQFTQPRRSTQGFQVLNANVDRMTISFDISGQLSFTLSGIGKARTTIAAPTFTFSNVRPFPVWAGAVSLSGLSGTYADLLKGSITITRNRKPMHTISNSQDMLRATIGVRMVEFDLTVDFDSMDEYNDFVGALTDSLLIKWVDAGITIGGTSNPEFEIKLGTILYSEAVEDTDTDLPSLNLRGKALYNATDASLAVARIKSTLDYTL
jgi:hypothetical protein